MNWHILPLHRRASDRAENPRRPAGAAHSPTRRLRIDRSVRIDAVHVTRKIVRMCGGRRETRHQRQTDADAIVFCGGTRVRVRADPAMDARRPHRTARRAPSGQELHPAAKRHLKQIGKVASGYL